MTLAIALALEVARTAVKGAGLGFVVGGPYFGWACHRTGGKALQVVRNTAVGSMVGTFYGTITGGIFGFGRFLYGKSSY